MLEVVIVGYHSECGNSYYSFRPQFKTPLLFLLLPEKLDRLELSAMPACQSSLTQFSRILLIAAHRMVHETDIVEMELKSKKFTLAVRKKEAIEQPEPVYVRTLPFFAFCFWFDGALQVKLVLNETNCSPSGLFTSEIHSFSPRWQLIWWSVVMQAPSPAQFAPAQQLAPPQQAAYPPQAPPQQPQQQHQPPQPQSSGGPPPKQDSGASKPQDGVEVCSFSSSASILCRPVFLC